MRWLHEVDMEEIADIAAIGVSVNTVYLKWEID